MENEVQVAPKKWDFDDTDLAMFVCTIAIICATVVSVVLTDFAPLQIVTVALGVAGGLARGRKKQNGD